MGKVVANFYIPIELCDSSITYTAAGCLSHFETIDCKTRPLARWVTSPLLYNWKVWSIHRLRLALKGETFLKTFITSPWLIDSMSVISWNLPAKKTSENGRSSPYVSTSRLGLTARLFHQLIQESCTVLQRLQTWMLHTRIRIADTMWSIMRYALVSTQN